MEYVLLVSLVFGANASNYQVDFASEELCKKASDTVTYYYKASMPILTHGQAPDDGKPYAVALCLKRK